MSVFSSITSAMRRADESEIVSQTERAAAVAQDMHATIQTTEQQMLRSLTPEQIAALESALRTIYADLG